MTGEQQLKTQHVPHFQSAQRHSRLVRRLRWWLPLLGAAAALVFIVMSLAKSFLLPGVQIGPVELKGSTLVMENPKLSGHDRNKRAYEFSAQTATQDVKTPKKIHLDRITARMELAANGWTKIQADRGLFDGYEETFFVEGHIQAATSLEYEVRLQDALIDMKKGTMLSQKPVEVRQGNNRITADRLSVYDSGGVILFEGHVRAVFTPESVGEN